MATSAAPPFTSLVTLPASSSCHSSSSKLSPFHAFIRASASDHTVPATRCSQHTPRREFLKGVALQALPLLLLREPPPSLAREVEVGSFLPPSPSDPSFVQFKASPKDTPALRAGTLIFTSFQKRKKKKCSEGWSFWCYLPSKMEHLSCWFFACGYFLWFECWSMNENTSDCMVTNQLVIYLCIRMLSFMWKDKWWLRYS